MFCFGTSLVLLIICFVLISVIQDLREELYYTRRRVKIQKESSNMWYSMYSELQDKLFKVMMEVN